jgi:hypothetical protein
MALAKDLYLLQYTMNGFQEAHNTHRVLVGTPLILVILFSFAFLLMNPVTADQPPAVSQTTQTSTPDEQATQLPPIALAETSLPTLSQVPTTDTGDSAASAGRSKSNSTPQATARTASSLASTSPQSAAVRQSINPSAPISIKLNQPVSTLTNLLH